MSQFPGTYFPWPYAAKCFPVFDFVTDDVLLYMTFPIKMDQTLEPPLSNWDAYFSGGWHTPDSATWVDAWTYRLRFDNVGGLPSRVVIAYAPTTWDLRTTYGKRWEAWGTMPVMDIST